MQLSHQSAGQASASATGNQATAQQGGGSPRPIKTRAKRGAPAQAGWRTNCAAMLSQVALGIRDVRKHYCDDMAIAIFVVEEAAMVAGLMLEELEAPVVDRDDMEQQAFRLHALLHAAAAMDDMPMSLKLMLATVAAEADKNEFVGDTSVPDEGADSKGLLARIARARGLLGVEVRNTPTPTLPTPVGIPPAELALLAEVKGVLNWEVGADDWPLSGRLVGEAQDLAAQMLKDLPADPDDRVGNWITIQALLAGAAALNSTPAAKRAELTALVIRIEDDALGNAEPDPQTWESAPPHTARFMQGVGISIDLWDAFDEIENRDAPNAAAPFLHRACSDPSVLEGFGAGLSTLLSRLPLGELDLDEVRGMTYENFMTEPADDDWRTRLRNTLDDADDLMADAGRLAERGSVEERMLRSAMEVLAGIRQDLAFSLAAEGAPFEEPLRHLQEDFEALVGASTKTPPGLVVIAADLARRMREEATRLGEAVQS